tara:strand:+ start:200 stop:625 length:426 start_codon:yes stop_codon:yes gene_type:complete
MKAAPTAKPFFLAAYGRKFLTALLTRLDRCSFFLAVFVPACHRAKSLPFVIGFKRVLAVVAYFIHALIIPYLFINDQTQTNRRSKMMDYKKKMDVKAGKVMKNHGNTSACNADAQQYDMGRMQKSKMESKGNPEKAFEYKY